MRLFIGLFLATACFIAPAHAQDAVARGRYLAILGDCAGCHTAPHGAAYAGGLPFTAAFGTVYSTNITPDRQTGIGKWNEAQFYRALHEGIAADGSHLYPAFPYVYFTRLSRAQTHDLFVYLRMLKPVRQAPTPDRLLFPFNIRAVMIFWNWLFLDDARYRPDPHRSPAWNRGNFLVNGPGHCAACHTPKNILFGDERSKALTGAVVGNWFSANLTGSRIDGLGKWSRADVVTYLATGRNRYATAAGAMQEKVSQSTSHMTPSDRGAIATYLKSLSPHQGTTPKAPGVKQMASGEALFVARCSVCHRPPGPERGPLPDYPQLAGDTLVLGRDPTTVVRIILEGAQSPVTPNAATSYSMPSFAALPDGKIADVATYLRNSWGNRASPVTRRMVTRLRAAVANSPG